MKPWFEDELTEADILKLEADIIKFPTPKAKVIQMPNVQEYPDFITGVQDLQAKQKDGTISQESYDKLYAELIHRFMKKESFETPWYLRELRGSPQSIFKSWLQKELLNLGIPTTSSSRHGTHIRFQMAGDINDFQKFFGKLGITVAERPTMSGSYDTYTLTLNKAIGNIPARTQLPWVNNYVGKDSKTGKTFGTKELTPDSLALSGARVNQQKILATLKESIKKNHPEYYKPLIQIANKSTSTGTSISLSGIDLSVFTPADIATVAKNYGEILSGLWSMSNLEFERVQFPKISNAAMIDFYGERDKNDYPVSVKSGAGSKVTIVNILNALEDKIREGKVNPSEEKSWDVFRIVRDNKTKEGMVKLHTHFNTKPIKELAQLMKTSVANITLETIHEWLTNKETFRTKRDIKKTLEKWYANNGMSIKDKTWKKSEIWKNPTYFVGAPLGQWIYKFLNKDEEIRESLTTLAKQLSIIQININIKKSLLTFQHNKFSDAEFKFDWPGWDGGNKLAFKMNLKP